MNIVCAESVALADPLFSHLGTVTLLPDEAITNDILKGADALVIRSKTKIDAALLDQTPVRFVGTATAGVDHLDVDFLERSEIVYAHAAGSNAKSVAEYVIASLLSLGQQQNIKLKGKTIGIIGCGHVGSILATYAKALGLHVLKNDPLLEAENPSGDFVKLDTLLESSDIVSLHVPLTHEGKYPTYRLANNDFFSQLKMNSIFINTSRGEVVDEAALLKTEHVSHMILDVWDNEPHWNIALMEKATISTPHIAGYAYDARVSGSVMIYKALCDQLSILPIDTDEVFQSRKQSLERDWDAELEVALSQIIHAVYDPIDDVELLAGCATHADRAQCFKDIRQHYRRRLAFSHYSVMNVAETLLPALKILGFE